jgi:hypothetical protein
MSGKKTKLSLELTPEQLKVLKPLLDSAGQIKIAGSIEGNRLDVSFLACNAAFLACNAAFTVKGGGISSGG